MPNINKQYQNLASKGRYGDTMLAHINPQEAGLLTAMGGAGTINPRTGLPEFYGIGQLRQMGLLPEPYQAPSGTYDMRVPPPERPAPFDREFADVDQLGMGIQRTTGYTLPNEGTYQGIPLVAKYDEQGNFRFLTLEEGNALTPDPSRPNIQSVPRLNAQGEVIDLGIVDVDEQDNGIFGGFKELGTELAPLILAGLGANFAAGNLGGVFGGGASTAGAGAAAGGAGVPGGLMGSTLPAGAGAGGFFAPGVTAGAATLGIPTMTGAPAGVTPSFAGGASNITSFPGGINGADTIVGSAVAPAASSISAKAAAAGFPTTAAGLLDFAAKNPSLVGGAIGAITGAVGAANAPKSTTTTASIDPDLKKEYLANIERAKETAAGLGVRQFEGFTPDYLKGQDQVINLGLGGKGQQTTDEAARLAMIEAGFTPEQIQAATAGDASLANAQGYTAQQMAAAQANRGNIANVGSAAGAQYMGAYQNPFEEQVVQGALADIERTRQIQEQANRAQATSARAFGGSRQGVVSGMTNEAALRQAASTSGQLRSAGFNAAAQLGQTDAARALQAQLANQGIDITIEQANAQLRQQGSLANQAALNQAAQFGAGATNQANLSNAAALNQMAQYNASMRQQAALANQGAFAQGAGIRQAAIGQLGQLGAQQQNLGLTGANAVMEAQMRQQALRQARLDAERNLGIERLGITSGSLGIGIPNLGGSTSQPLYSSTAGSALSGGLTGSYIGSLIGGAPTPKPYKPGDFIQGP